MLLQQLIGKKTISGNSVQKSSRSKTAKSRNDSDTEVRKRGDSRCVQVKSAVRRGEKMLFESLALKRDTTLSDLIRDYLLQEAKRDRLL